MMEYKRLHLFIYLLAIFSCSPGFCRDLGEIYDAVFSPDGQTIGVGTSTGFHRFERATMNYIDSITTEGGVHFILWSPDGNKVLLAHWLNSQNTPAPVYSIWDCNRINVTI